MIRTVKNRVVCVTYYYCYYIVTFFDSCRLQRPATSGVTRMIGFWRASHTRTLIIIIIYISYSNNNKAAAERCAGGGRVRDFLTEQYDIYILLYFKRNPCDMRYYSTDWTDENRTYMYMRQSKGIRSYIIHIIRVTSRPYPLQQSLLNKSSYTTGRYNGIPTSYMAIYNNIIYIDDGFVWALAQNRDVV